ncbi:MAG: ParB N-terminal domain-containing protein [Devosia sp.]|nr:ParB N-terminal domain-containing protein [Devosia sp.]
MTTKRALKAAAEPLAIAYSLIPLGLIDVPADRLRQPDADWVHVIGKSMAESGQLQPIRVTPAEDGRYELVFGLARLLAARELGWASVDAGIVEAEALDDQHKRLAHIFENLIRHDLKALDRAIALAEMKRIHEALYPETKNGGDRKSKQWLSDQNAKLAVWSFSQEATEKTGFSERAIFRAVAIAEGLTPASLERLRGSAFDNDQAGLSILAELTHGLQAAVLDIVLAEKPRASSIADALILARGGKLASAAEKRFASLADSLSRFKPAERAQIFALHEDEVLAWAEKRLVELGRA